MRSGIVLLSVLLTAAAQENPQQHRFPLEKIAIEGTRFPQTAVLEITGLKTGAMVSEADFDAAARKLKETGLFENVGFQFGPGPQRGFVVSFTISDYPDWLAASIEVPGAVESEIWKCIEARFPIVTPKSVPYNDGAESFYANAIQQCLAAEGRHEEIIARTFSALGKGPDEVVFRPKALPVISALRFEGARAVSAGALLSALSPIAVGSEYLERGFREMLERNALPIYEELGYLRTSFPKIAAAAADAGSVVVTVTVAEGPVYTLGGVTVEGEGVDAAELLRLGAFHRGQLANWSDILKRIQEMEQPLRRQGYLAVQFVPERIFNEASHVVDLKITVHKGAPFYFGKLLLRGFPAGLDAAARAAWTMRTGAIMDEEYPQDFLKSLRSRQEFAGIQHFGVALEPGAAQNIMDVIITAR